jgi:hypothetical protein
MSLTIQLADKSSFRWAQQQVVAHHYLHTPVDARCSPVAYTVLLDDQRVGCIIFGRPESTKCNGWYGSVEDVLAQKCYLTRWQVLNLCRVWLDPIVQVGGQRYTPNAATMIIAQALRRVVVDYLIQRPPVWMQEPYEVREVLSYCDLSKHRGTIYKAANFQLRRENVRGIQTYAIPVRRLTHAEHAAIAEQSRMSPRSRQLRSERISKESQLPLFEEAI